MPVFDARARFIGYSRTVAWDRDLQMLVPPDKISAARTATRSEGDPKPVKPSPWWGR